MLIILKVVMKILLILTFFCVFQTSCQKQEVCVFCNLDIETMSSIAREKNQLFCCVLIDSLSDEMKLFNGFVNTNKQISDKVLFNFIEVTDSCNFWYIQWLRPVSNTVSCVFSPSGELINLINGGTYESFVALKKSIVNNDNEYFFPNKWNMAKDTIIPFMNEVLQCKIKYDRGEDIQRGIDNSLSVLKYPFNLGLKLANDLKKKRQNRFTIHVMNY